MFIKELTDRTKTDPVGFLLTAPQLLSNLKRAIFFAWMRIILVPMVSVAFLIVSVNIVHGPTLSLMSGIVIGFAVTAFFGSPLATWREVQDWRNLRALVKTHPETWSGLGGEEQA